jgi:hypothetical protein
MKAKITRTDGVVLELDGTPEEIQKLIPLQWSLSPGVTIWPQWPVVNPPLNPWNPPITWSVEGKDNFVNCDGHGIVVDASPATATSGYIQGLGGSVGVGG